MSLMNFNWRPPDRQLRQFGLIACIALPLFGWWWSGGWWGVVLGLAGLGAGMAVVGWLRPQWLRPLFVLLCLIGWPIGLIVGELSLLAIYFGVMTPLGLLLRVLGRDGLRKRLEPHAATYWTSKPQPRGPQSYLKQW